MYIVYTEKRPIINNDIDDNHPILRKFIYGTVDSKIDKEKFKRKNESFSMSTLS